MQRSNWLWSLVFLAISITVTAFIFYCFWDRPEVEKLAFEAACAGRTSGCTRVRQRFQRTLFSKSWDYDVESKGYVHVVCRRAYILLGDYACTPSR